MATFSAKRILVIALVGTLMGTLLGSGVTFAFVRNGGDIQLKTVSARLSGHNAEDLVEIEKRPRPTWGGILEEITFTSPIEGYRYADLTAPGSVRWGYAILGQGVFRVSRPGTYTFSYGIEPGIGSEEWVNLEMIQALVFPDKLLREMGVVTREDLLAHVAYPYEHGKLLRMTFTAPNAGSYRVAYGAARGGIFQRQAIIEKGLTYGELRQKHPVILKLQITGAGPVIWTDAERPGSVEVLLSRDATHVYEIPVNLVSNR